VVRFLEEKADAGFQLLLNKGACEAAVQAKEEEKGEKIAELEIDVLSCLYSILKPMVETIFLASEKGA
ncbi:hypothetical protein MKW98_010187, partial [Papaver atlanticum]